MASQIEKLQQSYPSAELCERTEAEMGMMKKEIRRVLLAIVPIAILGIIGRGFAVDAGLDSDLGLPIFLLLVLVGTALYKALRSPSPRVLMRAGKGIYATLSDPNDVRRYANHLALLLAIIMLPVALSGLLIDGPYVAVVWIVGGVLNGLATRRYILRSYSQSASQESTSDS